MEHAPLLWHSGSSALREAHGRQVAADLGLAGVPAELRERTWSDWLPFPESLPVLLLLKSLGYRCGLITNWDVTAPAVLARLGLDRLLSPLVVSSEVGLQKPDARIFEMALDAVGARAQDAVYVGDNYWADVIGAERAGLRAVLVDRHPEWDGAVPECETIGDLWDLIRRLSVRPALAGRRA